MNRAGVRFTADGRMVAATADEVIKSIMDEFGLDKKEAQLFSDLGAKSTQDIMDLLLENLKTFCDVGGLGPTLGMVSATTAASGCIKHLVMLIDEMGQDKDGRYKKFVRDQTVMLKQIIDAALEEKVPDGIRQLERENGNGW